MDPYLCSLIDQLEQTPLSASQWIQLLNGRTPELAAYLFEKSRRSRIRFYGHTVYIRGLIEFTNYCKNNCYYCGIRSGNTHAHRYRLTKENILACCADGYKLGFRTFVLQGGEDPWYTTDRLSDLVHTIRTMYPDCAITLSIGEATKAEYQQLFDAGADRLLLRHETHKCHHYMHPPRLQDPQTAMSLLSAIRWEPALASWADNRTSGRGSFISQRVKSSNGGNRTIYSPSRYPVCKTKSGDSGADLVSSGTHSPDASKSTAPGNHCPWNHCPQRTGTWYFVRDQRGQNQNRYAGDYLLYDNKISTDAEAAECRAELEQRMQSIGYQVITDRGDSLNITP